MDPNAPECPYGDTCPAYGPEYADDDGANAHLANYRHELAACTVDDASPARSAEPVFCACPCDACAADDHGSCTYYLKRAQRIEP